MAKNDFKISDDQEYALKIANLRVRPNNSSLYGASGLSGKELQEKFDAYPHEIKERLNALVDKLFETAAGDDTVVSDENIIGMLPTGIEVTEDGSTRVLTLRELIAHIKNGTLGSVSDLTPADGYVTENKLGAGAVTEEKINIGAVTANKIGAEAVTDGKIHANAVTTDKISDGAVTHDKLSAESGSEPVETENIKDGAVTGDKLSQEYKTGVATDISDAISSHNGSDSAHADIRGAIEDVENAMDDVEALAKGANKAIVFETKADMLAYIQLQKKESFDPIGKTFTAGQTLGYSVDFEVGNMAELTTDWFTGIFDINGDELCFQVGIKDNRYFTCITFTATTTITSISTSIINGKLFRFTGNPMYYTVDQFGPSTSWWCAPIPLTDIRAYNIDVGTNFYIIDTEVPDYWWDGANAQELETAKVNLDEYAKTTDLAGYTTTEDLEDNYATKAYAESLANGTNSLADGSVTDAKLATAYKDSVTAAIAAALAEAKWSGYWDAMQDSGHRRDYARRFAEGFHGGSWTDAEFNPKYSIIAIGAANAMFYRNFDLVNIACKFAPNTDLSFNTAAVTSLESAFTNCRALTAIPPLDLTACTVMDSAFWDCVSLTSLTLSHISGVTNWSGAFHGCRRLTTLNISGGGFTRSVDLSQTAIPGTALVSGTDVNTEMFAFVDMNPSAGNTSPTLTLTQAQMNAAETALPDFATQMTYRGWQYAIIE